MRVCRCINHYESVFSAGANAKTATNNLPILPVLGFRANIIVLIQILQIKEKAILTPSSL
jgi:hypothetical protein